MISEENKYIYKSFKFYQKKLNFSFIISVENFINNSERDTLGFLLNIQMPRKLYHRLFRFSSRHWLSIRTSAKNGTFVVCDSN